MARIAIGGFQHETNCFVPGRTDLAYFESHRDRPPLVRGSEVMDWLPGAGLAIAGVIERCAGAHDLVPLLWTSGGAGPLVTAHAFAAIAGELESRLADALPVDAVYLDLHGAMVAESHEDGEGALLARLRAVAGPEVPIVASLDYHANVTAEMTRHADALVAYLTYPHVDRIETGHRAAAALDAVLARGRPAGRALRRLPFLLPLEEQCTLVEPCAGIVAAAAERPDGVVARSFLAGFPPSDLAECGPSVVCHAWTQADADRAADALADAVAARESEFAVPLLPAAEAAARAVAVAATRPGAPVVVADSQDNPGCGASADTTGLLAALMEAGAEGAVIGYFCDAEAAAGAHEAGVGATVEIALGGRSGPEGVAPWHGRFRVAALGSGRFDASGKVLGRRRVDAGPMALLEAEPGGVSVAVTSKRLQAHDPAGFRHLGVEPADQAILGLKSTCHFRAEFQPIAAEVIVAIAPGHYRADPAAYPYRRLREGVRLRPLGPPFRP